MISLEVVVLHALRDDLPQVLLAERDDAAQALVVLALTRIRRKIARDYAPNKT